MTSHPVLGQVALGYSPMIDRHRAVTALRLTVFPARPEATPKAGDLLAAMAETWPADAGRLSLNIVGENLLQDLLQTELPLKGIIEFWFDQGTAYLFEAVCGLRPGECFEDIRGRVPGVVSHARSIGDGPNLVET